MTCQSCGHEIADNAIVCYRCGAATAIPASSARPPAASPRAGRSRNLVLLLIVVVIIAVVLALRFGWHLL